MTASPIKISCLKVHSHCQALSNNVTSWYTSITRHYQISSLSFSLLFSLLLFLNLLYTSVWSTQQVGVKTCYLYSTVQDTLGISLESPTAVLSTISQKSVHHSTHCSSPTASRLQSKGSHAKSMMLVP